MIVYPIIWWDFTFRYTLLHSLHTLCSSLHLKTPRGTPAAQGRSSVVSCVARKPPLAGVVRRLCARVPRTKVARCGVCDFLLASHLYTRGRICAVYVCTKPHPLLVLLALCGCGSADCALCGAVHSGQVLPRT